MAPGTAENKVTDLGSPIPKLNGVVEITGKVEEAREHNEKYYTRIIMPAPDEFSKPQTVEIRSNSKIGKFEEVITVDCQLGGFKRTSNGTLYTTNTLDAID